MSKRVTITTVVVAALLGGGGYAWSHMHARGYS